MRTTTTTTETETGSETRSSRASAKHARTRNRNRNQNSKTTKAVLKTRVKESKRSSAKGKRKVTGVRQKPPRLRTQGRQSKGQNVIAKKPSTSKHPLDQALDDLSFQQTRVEESFHWPSVLLQSFTESEGRKDQDHMSKPVHVQMWTEFSGAATPEFALEALAGATDKLTAEVISTGDWGTNPRTTLMNNTDSKTHVFGDISDVLTDEMKMLAERRVPVEVSISKQDILRALGSGEFMKSSLEEAQAATEEGVAAKKEVYCVDNLFKRKRGETQKGYLKVKFLGNALKDYQLVRVRSNLDHDEHASNEPCWESFSKARTTLGELLRQSDPLCARTFVFLRRQTFSELKKIILNPAYPITDQCRCYKHGRNCSRRIQVHSDSVPPTSKVMTVLTAGSACTDFSSYGNQQMAAGPTTIFLLILLRLVMEWLPMIFIHENVVPFPLSMIAEVIGAAYFMEQIVLSPETSGFPVSRRRQYCLARLTMKLQMYMEIDDIAKQFWAKTESLLQKISALDLLAAESDSLQCLGRSTLSESMFTRLLEFQHYFPDGKFFDLSQRPSHRARCGTTLLPTLTKTCGSFWSVDKSRFCCGAELLMAHGLPIASWAATAMGTRKYNIVGLNNRGLSLLAGNSMHVVSVGLVLFAAIFGSEEAD